MSSNMVFYNPPRMSVFLTDFLFLFFFFLAPVFLPNNCQTPINILFCFQVEELIEKFNKFGRTVVGVCVEPIQGEGGDNMATPYFYRALQRITKKVSNPLIRKSAVLCSFCSALTLSIIKNGLQDLHLTIALQ